MQRDRVNLLRGAEKFLARLNSRGRERNGVKSCCGRNLFFRTRHGEKARPGNALSNSDCGYHDGGHGYHGHGYHGGGYRHGHGHP